MLNRLCFILDTLGSSKVAAFYLGYSTRQFYNLRKNLEQGKRLHKRAEIHIVNMAGQLGYEETNPPEGHSSVLH